MKGNRPSPGPTVAALALAFLWCHPAAPAPATNPSDLAGPLDSYERAAEALARTGTAEERGAAIAALAHLASSRYGSVRDALASDPSPTVQLDLLSAMVEMGDTSELAQRILWTCLVSADERVVADARLVEYQNLQIPIPFEKIWNASRPTLLWIQGGIRNDELTGVGQARPWRDPAWAKISRETQLGLLCRAGTREAVPLATAEIEAMDHPSWYPLRVIEPVDRPYLRELVRDPRPEVRNAASRALILARDQEHLAYLSHLIDDHHRQGSEIRDSDWAELAMDEALPSLTDATLRSLLARTPPEHFRSVERELSKRGTQLSYAQLMGRTGFPSKAYLLDVENLWPEQLHALVREKLYEELSAQLTVALCSTDWTNDLRTFIAAINGSQEFLNCLPSEVAQACTRKLNAWLTRTNSQCFTSPGDRRGVEEALELVGILATRAEEAALWKKWRDAKDPFRDAEALLPVVWGTSQRCEDVRRMLASVRDQGWSHAGRGPLVGALFIGEPPQQMTADPCRPSHGRLPDFLGGLPDSPAAFKQAKERLVHSLDVDALLDSRDAAASAFLELRGVPFHATDVAGACRLLGDQRASIRREAYAVAGPLVPARLGYVPEASVAQLRVRVEAISDYLTRLASIPPRPGPPISAADRAWLEGLFTRGREAYSADLIVRILKPAPEPVTESYGDPDPAVRYASLPSTVLLDAGMEHAEETRGLLKSKEAPVRQAAAWALWQMLRDPAALQVFLVDAQANEPRAKAQALYVLQQVRCRDAAALFPPLLADPDRTLRQVGLLGVQAFGLTGSLPDVEDLVTDLDGAVAATAVETLGLLHPAEAKPLLMALMAREGPLNRAASQALRRFPETDDVEAFIHRMADSAAGDAEKWALLGIVGDVAGRTGPQPWLPYYRPSEPHIVRPETIHDWEAWWSQNRLKSLSERTRHLIQDLVAAYLGETHPEKLAQRARDLARYFSIDTSISPASVEQSRKQFARDWTRVQDADIWDILTGLTWSRPLENIELLMRLDRQKARRYLYEIFASSARKQPLPVYVGSRSSSESYRDIIVRHSGVDFGDPNRARCGTKEAVLADWDAWAKKEGWAR